jgi:Molecular chaperone (small heat shock protein)
MRKQEQESTTDEGFHVRERRSGSFRRVVALPFAISDNADVVARYDNGVLRVLIPRPANPVNNTQRVSIS